MIFPFHFFKQTIEIVQKKTKKICIIYIFRLAIISNKLVYNLKVLKLILSSKVTLFCFCDN